MKISVRIAAPVAAALVVASCAALPMVGEDEGTRAVTGQMQTGEPVALPPGSELVVSFRGLDGEVLSEGRRRIDRHDPPYPFQLLIATDRIGTISGRVEADEATHWRTVSVLIEEGSGPVDLGQLMLGPVDAGFAAAAGGADVQPVAGVAAGGMDAGAAGDVAEMEAARLAQVQEPAPEPETGPELDEASGPIRLECGGSEITVTEAGGGADVAVGSTVLEMQAADASGSGRRYVAPGDPATYLALDGETVEVSFAGVVLQDCGPAEE